MNSPCYEPAGLLVACAGSRVLIDGGPGATAKKKLTAWLVTDDRCELIREIQKLAERQGLKAEINAFVSEGLLVRPRAVIHTSHAAYGYLICAAGKKIVWAPEFLKFPRWARAADLMFAEAAGWKRPILFRGGSGGHACVKQVAHDAQLYEVGKLVFAHIGRPTIRAIATGEKPAFGEFGSDGDVYRLNAEGVFSRRRTRTA